MKFKADLSLNIWVSDVEVEGKDTADAENNLYKMTVEELLEKGYVKDSAIGDIDLTVAEQDIKVEVNNIKYDLSDVEEVGYNPAEELPTEYSLTISVKYEIDDYELADLILEELEDEIGADYPIDSFDYKIIEK